GAGFALGLAPAGAPLAPASRGRRAGRLSPPTVPHSGQENSMRLPTRPALWPCALLGLALAAPAGRADVIAYREALPNDGNSHALTRALDQGWQGIRGGGTTNSLQIFTPGSAELSPVNSNPVYGVNPPTPTGEAFWSPLTHDVTIYTTEFSLPVSS